MSTNAHQASEKPKEEPVKPVIPDAGEPKPAPKPEKEEPHARARQHK